MSSEIRLCVSEDLLSQRILSFCAVLSRLHCDIREETADDDCKYQSLWTRFARHASLPLDEQGIINHGEGSMHDSVPKSCEAGDTTQIRPGDMDILGAVMIARAKCLVEQAQVRGSWLWMAEAFTPIRFLFLGWCVGWSIRKPISISEGNRSPPHCEE